MTFMGLKRDKALRQRELSLVRVSLTTGREAGKQIVEANCETS